MARNSTGHEALEQARGDLTRATTLHDFRIAQAVVLPLDLGISLTQTAELIGKTPGWVARARIRYISLYNNDKKIETRGGRRNNLMSEEDEVQCVKAALILRRNSFFTLAVALKKVLEDKVQRPIAFSTAYNILNRVRSAHRVDYEIWKSWDYYLEHRMRKIS